MIEEIMICDRCKKRCDISRNNRGFHIFKRRLILTRSTEYDKCFDLCQDCYNSLAKWFKEGSSESDKTLKEGD